MIAELAKKFHAEHRGNCAMSVAYAHSIANGKTEDEAIAFAAGFKTCGGGQAPNGTCGALYAALQMKPKFANEIEEKFKEGAKGCTLCKQIRPNAVIPCNGCVELAGRTLDEVTK